MILTIVLSLTLSSGSVTACVFTSSILLPLATSRSMVPLTEVSKIGPYRVWIQVHNSWTVVVNEITRSIMSKLIHARIHDITLLSYCFHCGPLGVCINFWFLFLEKENNLFNFCQWKHYVFHLILVWLVLFWFVFCLDRFWSIMINDKIPIEFFRPAKPDGSDIM